MFTLQHIADADAVDWDALYPRAVAIGCRSVLNRASERVAACHELLALTPGELPSLGILAMFTQLAPGHDGYACALSRQACIVLRLLDSALTAHGRATTGMTSRPGASTPATRPGSAPRCWVRASPPRIR